MIDVNWNATNLKTLSKFPQNKNKNSVSKHEKLQKHKILIRGQNCVKFFYLFYLELFYLDEGIWLSAELGLAIISGKKCSEKRVEWMWENMFFMLFFFGSLSGLEIMFWFGVQLTVDKKEFWKKNKKNITEHLL
jgi:hypothetical protein